MFCGDCIAYACLSKYGGTQNNSRHELISEYEKTGQTKQIIKRISFIRFCTAFQQVLEALQIDIGLLATSVDSGLPVLMCSVTLVLECIKFTYFIDEHDRS